MPETLTRKKKGTNGQRGVASAPVVDFTAAAHEHVEPMSDDTRLIGAAAHLLGPYDVPAYGYLRHVCVLVEASGGVIGAGVLHEDSPFRVLQEVTLLDVNGAPIFGPYDGYEALISNIYGGYAFQQDPRLQPDAVLTGVGWSFMLRIPVEISHNNGLGSLPNQNAAASYKLRIGVNTSGEIFSTAPTTPPSVRVRTWVECWSQPTPTDPAGRPQQLAPPRYGTTQYWSKFTKDVAAGNSKVLLPRVGNLLRGIVIIARTDGDRTTASLPDPLLVNWDARQLENSPRYLLRAYMVERYLHSAAGVPAGVLAWMKNHDTLGHGGDETPELWIPTVQSTRLELEGTWGAAQLTILTNDVAPVEVSQAERYIEQSETGFEPMAVGPQVTAN